MSFTKCDEWEQKETGGLQVLEIWTINLKWMTQFVTPRHSHQLWLNIKIDYIFIICPVTADLGYVRVEYTRPS
jgi:hypothetical protein